MTTLDRADKFLWILLLLLVPVSASPLLPFGSGTLVRPLSFAPALLILLLAAFRIIVMKQSPRFRDGGGRPLVVFMVYVVIGDHLLRGSSYHCTEDIAARRALNMKPIISSLACVCVAE